MRVREHTFLKNLSIDSIFFFDVTAEVDVVAAPGFDEELKRSRVYHKGSIWQWSKFSSECGSTTSSLRSALSLADFLDVSTIDLPITVEDIYDPRSSSSPTMSDDRKGPSGYSTPLPSQSSAHLDIHSRRLALSLTVAESVEQYAKIPPPATL